MKPPLLVRITALCASVLASVLIAETMATYALRPGWDAAGGAAARPDDSRHARVLPGRDGWPEPVVSAR